MSTRRDSVAEQLAQWAYELSPAADDLDLARRSLLDTVAVTLAGRDHSVAHLAASLSEAGRWAAVGHVLDFDDLHLESTTHISVMCVPTALAVRGDARAYLAGAGVLARLGNALGWAHYASGWHITCTAGAPAVAAGAAVALGLNPVQIATAMGLAVPGAGGVQRSFGTDGKSLQVGFAVEAGIRAAQLAAAGAHTDPWALDSWMELVGGHPDELDLAGPAIPGGLAIKMYPACYALQRPINAISTLAVEACIRAEDVTRVVLQTPEGTVSPLLHHRPETGLQGKFSVEYAVATALLDDYQGFDSFSDAAVRRTQARRLVELVEVHAEPGGDWLLDGELRVELHTRSGDIRRATLQYPPGAPQRPPTDGQLQVKLMDCLEYGGLPDLNPASWDWHNAADVLRAHLNP